MVDLGLLGFGMALPKGNIKICGRLRARKQMANPNSSTAAPTAAIEDEPSSIQTTPRRRRFRRRRRIKYDLEKLRQVASSKEQAIRTLTDFYEVSGHNPGSVLHRMIEILSSLLPPFEAVCSKASADELALHLLFSHPDVTLKCKDLGTDREETMSFAQHTVVFCRRDSLRFRGIGVTATRMFFGKERHASVALTKMEYFVQKNSIKFSGCYKKLFHDSETYDVNDVVSGWEEMRVLNACR